MQGSLRGNNQESRQSGLGFTIVEIAIVIVVLAILTTLITVVSKGAVSMAREESLKSDLLAGSTHLEKIVRSTGDYPVDVAALDKSEDTVFTYFVGDRKFCLAASNKDFQELIFHITHSGDIQPGGCDAIENQIASMQSFTQSQCDKMAVYTGANPQSIITLSDSRGSTTRFYEVARLLDRKCWMLTNLRLGSTSSTTTLTAADSNVTSSFRLPKLITSGATDFDTPKAYGPVPGDSGSGETNYGYLYNW